MTKHLARWLILIILMVCGFTYTPMSRYITGPIAYPTDPLYGAKGDGVTDDTAAVQAAVTAVGNTGGGLVAFAPGTYLINNGHIIIPSNVTMDGLALGSVTILCSRTRGANHYGIFTNSNQSSGNSNIIIKDLVFNRTVALNSFDEIIYMVYPINVTVDHCSFSNAFYGAYASKVISYQQPLYCTVANCYFNGTNGNGIAFSGYGGTNTPSYSIIKNNQIVMAANSGNDPIIITTENVTVEGNYIYGGINEIAGANNLQNLGNKFVNNNFVDSILGLRTQKDYIVTGNYFYSDSVAQCKAGPSNAVSDYAGVPAGEDGVISNNIVVGAGGITVGGNGVNITVEGNVLEGLGTTSTTASGGINAATTVNNLQIKGNIIKYGWSGGITLEQCNNPIIVDNSLDTPVKTRSPGWRVGMYVGQSQDPVIANNVIVDKNVSSLMINGFFLDRNAGTDFRDNSVMAYSGTCGLFANSIPLNGFAKRSGNVFNMIPVDPTVRSASAVPTTDTWHPQQVLWSTAATSGNPMGWYCTAGGTFSSYSSIGDTTTGSPVISSVASTRGLQAGQYISAAAGFPATGPYMVLELTAKSITINALATGNHRGTAVVCPPPAFKAMPNYP